MGPAMAKMVALGCTIVPGDEDETFVRETPNRLRPAPIVISPLSSTSWQTIALECIVNLSRLERRISVDQCGSRDGYIGGMAGQCSITGSTIMLKSSVEKRLE